MIRKVSPNRYVGYIRVSTRSQGLSGLGLEAQKKAIEDYVSQHRGTLAETFTEVESGKVNDRPQLRKALETAELTGSTLVIARLDRLSRKAAFILNLLEGSEVNFVAVDNPNATRLNLHIMAIMAEDEGHRISERTKSALQAAKARGKKLGRGQKPRELKQSVLERVNRVNPDLVQAKLESMRWFFPQYTDDQLWKVTGNQLGAAMARDTIRERSHRFSGKVGPMIKSIRARGITSTPGIARALNDKGITTAKGFRWTPTQVARVLKQMEGR